MNDTETQSQPYQALLAGLIVLLVEDEPDIAELLTFILEEHGAEVVLANSALEALARLGQRQPNVLVSNVRLPEEDGRWLIEQIRQLEGMWSEFPAVAVTSYTGKLTDREHWNQAFNNSCPSH